VDFTASVSATIYPGADTDYYTLPIGQGNLQVTMTLPASPTDGAFEAYAMYLFDSDRNYLTEAVPVINTYGGACPDTGDCSTLYPTLTLSYAVPRAGRYYLLVSGGPTANYGNSPTYSVSPYTLAFSYNARGGAEAHLENGSSSDNDTISFTVPYNRFLMNASPSSSTIYGGTGAGTTLDGAEQIFAYAQLRDHNNQKLDLARTNLTLGQGSLLRYVNGSLALDTDMAGRPIMTGQVKLQPGFAARYPGVGTVALEVFGRNHFASVISLGISGPINLTTDKAAVTAYNNIIGAPGARATVKYDALSAGSLSLKIYTQTGALVKTLYEGPIAAGKGSFDWDGTSSSGERVASGIYFLKAKGPGLDKVDKIAVVR
jgi:hypothetical protein